MSPEDRQRAVVRLHESIERLEWGNTLPHTFENVQRMEQETERLNAESERRPRESLSHADPTANAVGMVQRGHSFNTSAEPTAIDTQLSEVAEAADELDHLVSDALGRERWSPKEGSRSLIGITSTAIARLHHAAPNLSVALGDYDLAPTMLGLLSTIDDGSLWLHKKATSIYVSSRPTTREPVMQKPLRGCVSCARVIDPSGKPTFVPVAHGRYSDHCRDCGDYKGSEKREPPMQAVEWMLRHGKHWTSKVLTDALRAERGKVAV